MLSELIKKYTIEPNSYENTYNLGKEYESLKQYPPAIGFFTKAQDIAEDNNLLYNALVSAAKCFIMRGDAYEMAKKILVDAAKTDNSRHEAYYFIAVIEKILGNEGAFKNYYDLFMKTKGEDTVYNCDENRLLQIQKRDIVELRTVRSIEDAIYNEELIGETQLGIDNSEKLRDIIPNILSLENSKIRRDVLEKTMQSFGIKESAVNIFRRFEDSDIECEVDIHDDRIDAIKGIYTSHVFAIKRWYEETDEEWGLFFEDDVCLSNVNHWNFTLSDFINILSVDWEAITLCGIYETDSLDMRVRRRNPYDHGLQAYALKRSYAKKLLDTVIIGNRKILFKNPGENILSIENALVSETYGNVYTFPLFNHNMKVQSTRNSMYESDQKFIEECYDLFMHGKLSKVPGNAEVSLRSHKSILMWWQNYGSNLSLKQIMEL